MPRKDPTSHPAFGPTDVRRGQRRPPPPGSGSFELVILEGNGRGRRFPLEASRTTLGKAPENDVVLDDPAASRQHAVVEESAGGFLLRDLESTNGTMVGGLPVREISLIPGLLFTLGDTVLRFQHRGAHQRSVGPLPESFGGLAAASPAMRELFGYLERVARTDLTVTLIGETGTGKEVLSRAVHDASPRKDGPFVVFDCAATEPNFVAASLFGHTEGAFTGAVGSRKGAFLSADGGTLFIDEVGELPLDLQPRLLRVLEKREVQPLGSDRSRPVDVRVVSATHRSLERMVESGKFRQDLYFRLSGIVLEVPSLKDRREDIVPLARRFLAAVDPALTFDPVVEPMLLAHDWPGNVRELKNVIERGAVLAHGPLLGVEDLVLGPVVGGQSTVTGAAPAPVAARSLDEVERDAVVSALAATGGNRVHAARILRITPKTLRQKIARYGLGRASDDDD